MNNLQKMFEDIMGAQGYHTLSKAIFKQRSQSVVDPSEQLLGLLTAPRAVLSWLVINLKPMKVGEYKELPFPGRDDIKIQIEKQDIDVYRAEFIQGGQVIHRFEKQSLPSVASHLVTTGELYEEDCEEEECEEEAPEPKSEPKSESKPVASPSPGLDAVKAILSMNNFAAPAEEEAKWMWAHANVKELSGVIGKLVDALVANHQTKQNFDKAFDKKEIKVESSKIQESECPEEIGEKLLEDKKKDPSIIREPVTQDRTYKVRKLADTKKQELKGDEQKIQESECPEEIGEKLLEDKKKDPSIIREPVTQDRTYKVRSLRDTLKREVSQTLSPPVAKKKVNELLRKPYASEAQRRWAHTDAGTKALGGKQAVAHWDRASKGKDLPEQVSKADLDKAKIIDFKTRKLLADTSAPQPKVTLPSQHQPDTKLPKQPKHYTGRGLKSPAKQRTPKGSATPEGKKQWVYHRSHGLAEVVGKEKRSIAGGPDEHYYQLRIEDVPGAAKTVWMPERSMQSRTRPVMGADEAQKIAQRLKEPYRGAVDHQTWNRRYQSVLGRLHTGDPAQAADVIRELQARSERNFGEKKLLDAAKRALGREYSLVTGKDLFEDDDSAAKAEMPSGAGRPRKPAMPKPPTPPVPAGHQPAAQAAKQAEQSSRGQQPKPPKPNVTIPKQTMKDEDKYFRSRLARCRKSEPPRTFFVTDEELYNPCHLCGVPEFTKSETGHPKFTPCLCFRSDVIGADGRSKKRFATIQKREDGHYDITFDRTADKDSVLAFLRTLKNVLVKRYR